MPATSESARALQRTARCEEIAVRGLQYRVRHWGPDDAPVVFFLHGWMDASPTFQFVVEAFAHDWHIIAPDWRGHGGSTYLGRPYWFPDYTADLTGLLDHYAPDRPVTLVGHSMGAAVAALYAGVRPARVAKLAMLDFLGLKTASPDDAPARLGEWLDALSEPPRLRGYRDTAALARRLAIANPRLTPDRAQFLAEATARVRDDGQIELACDPWHKIPAPLPYRIEEVMAHWRQITCPVLQLVASHGFVQQRFGQDPEEFERRRQCFQQATFVTIAEAGHNLHHDQPAAVAAAIEAFLLAG